jgi:glutamyl-Q tRNA(Asp) synthetase
MVGRYAPSTTGLAHPGTLLAGLLCWLDARSQAARLILRLEDLDPQRCRPEYAAAMLEDLRWLGLDFDAVVKQSESRPVHERALDRLAAADVLYPCSCSRSEIRRHAERAPDGGYRYSNRCRERSIPQAHAGGWRACGEVLRVRLPDSLPELRDERSGGPACNNAAAYGDPVVRRRDGAVAYPLASVADDCESGVTRVVRGRDLAGHTGTQVALQHLLGFPTPVYRHHLLLLEPRGGKLAKLHGSVTGADLKPNYDAASLCGLLAYAAGLVDRSAPITPQELLSGFDWSGVGEVDRVLDWDGKRLSLRPLMGPDQAGTTSSSDASPGTPTRSGKP